MKRALDERGQYLYHSYGNRPNVKTIPYKKPARVDSYEETESANAPRKLVLAARSSGKGNPKNKPGDAANLGIYRKYYDWLLKRGWTEEAREASIRTRQMRAKYAEQIAHHEQHANKQDKKAQDESRSAPERAVRAMSANAHRGAIHAYERGDVESAKLHGATAQYILHGHARKAGVFKVEDVERLLILKARIAELRKFDPVHDFHGQFGVTGGASDLSGPAPRNPAIRAPGKGKGKGGGFKRGRNLSKPKIKGLKGAATVKPKIPPYHGKMSMGSHVKIARLYDTLKSLAGGSASDYIHDFVHSGDKRFKGDSKKQRIRRALGAYYNS